MKIRLQIPDLSILITIASSTLYIVFRNLGRELGSFAFLWAPISLLLIIYTRRSSFNRRPMRLLFFYGFLMVGILQFTLWSNMTEWNQVRILYEFYFIVVMTAILFYYWSVGDFRKLAFFSKWAFIFIIISLISTNIALFFDPLIVRESASTGRFTLFQKTIYQRFGVMGYGYMQAVVCLIPIIIFHIKSQKKMVFTPKVLIVILLLILITQIRSQVFANILATTLITIFSLIGSKKIQTSIVTIALFSFLIFVIPKSFYSDLLINLSSYFEPETEMHYKLTDFSSFIEDPEFDTSTGAGGRAERYPMLLEALLAEPLLGYASNLRSVEIMSGAHLYWMNRLALWGIPGFLFFLFVLYKIFRSIIALFDKEYRFYYFLSLAAFIFLGLTKAVGGTEIWLMLIVIIPGIYFLPLLQGHNELQNA